MILPDQKQFRRKEHWYLYNYDINEYFNKNIKNYARMHYINRIRKIIDLTNQYSNGKYVLDTGCAQANISTLLAEEGYKCIAFDLRYNFLTYAKLKWEYGYINYVCGNIDSLPFKKEVFDVIVLGEFLEHVAFPKKIVLIMLEHLKKNGIIIITTPNGSSLMNKFYFKLPTYINKNNECELVKRQYGPSGNSHLFLFTFNELQQLLESIGLKIIYSCLMNCVFFNPITNLIFRIFPINFLYMIEVIVQKIPYFKRVLNDKLIFVVSK